MHGPCAINVHIHVHIYMRDAHICCMWLRMVTCLLCRHDCPTYTVHILPHAERKRDN